MRVITVSVNSIELSVSCILTAGCVSRDPECKFTQGEVFPNALLA